MKRKKVKEGTRKFHGDENPLRRMAGRKANKGTGRTK